MIEKTEGQLRMNNPEAQTTLDTQPATKTNEI